MEDCQARKQTKILSSLSFLRKMREPGFEAAATFLCDTPGSFAQLLKNLVKIVWNFELFQSGLERKQLESKSRSRERATGFSCSL